MLTEVDREIVKAFIEERLRPIRARSIAQGNGDDAAKTIAAITSLELLYEPASVSLSA